MSKVLHMSIHTPKSEYEVRNTIESAKKMKRRVDIKGCTRATCLGWFSLSP